MINNTRIWVYDSTKTDYKGTELTQYLQPSDTWCDNLDDTLDTAEMTLVGYPTRDEFAPTTKLIVEKGSYSGSTWSPYETFNWVVSDDTVEQPIMSNDSYFTHSLSLIEPAVIAQQRLCDNFSVTYRLQDVNLDIKPTYDTESTMDVNRSEVSGVVRDRKFGYKSDIKYEIIRTRTVSTYCVGHKFEWVMPTWYQLQLYKETKASDGTITRTLETRTPSWDDWNDFKFNQEIPTGTTSKEIRLPIPMLKVYQGKEQTESEFLPLGFCSLEARVTRTKNNVTESVALTGGDSENVLTISPSTSNANEHWTAELWNPPTGDPLVFDQGYIAGSVTLENVAGTYVWQFPKSQVAQYASSIANRTLIFTAEAGYTYNISITRKPFSTMPYPYGNYYSTLQEIYSFGLPATRSATSGFAQQTNGSYPLVSSAFYAIAQGDIYTQFYHSAPPVSAYELFNKAQLTTQPFLLQTGISAYDMSKEVAPNGTIPKTPFYLSAEDEQELRYTQVIENFFNQQNLWQVFGEVGKYLHARPKVLFGSNDRYRVTWKRYGQTQQFEDNGTKSSVFNSRFVEEYVGATSSYVSNFVQLGGTRTEYLKAVGTEDNYTVSNDNSMLKTQSPIIEIVDMQVQKIGETTWYSLVGKNSFDDGSAGCGFIFEKGVYDTLDIDANVNINKGLAIYYTLGTNEISGFDFRLPTVNSGDVQNDYAIKKVIYRATSGNATGTLWSDIRINDYIFKITYRTKDTLRIEQSRPDLRKYLLGSKYDLAPQHYQFNNQQDIMVDSQAFGENVYGKLIRTGNTVFEISEWHSNYSDIKHAGELYKIYGNLYYVAKVTHQQFPDHIESRVEYSKDFNRLSQIIGIPSEPRFWEIGEQSNIRREKVISEYIAIGDQEIASKFRDDLTVSYAGLGKIRDIIFFNGKYPQWAQTTFTNDSGSQALYPQETSVLHGLMTYSSRTSLVMEWDMVDNYSAGDQTKETSASPTTADSAYRVMSPYRYCDEFGRADLVKFFIFDDYKTELTAEQIQALPQAPTTSKGNIFFRSGVNPHLLLKDNREAMSFNYTLQALTSSDRFVLSSYLWQEQKGKTYLAFGAEEINKIVNDSIMDNKFIQNAYGQTLLVEINSSDITIENRKYIKLNVGSVLNHSGITGDALTTLLNNTKSIVVASSQVKNTPNGFARLFVFAYNCSDVAYVHKTDSIYIGNVGTNFFTQHQ